MPQGKYKIRRFGISTFRANLRKTKKKEGNNQQKPKTKNQKPFKRNDLEPKRPKHYNRIKRNLWATKNQKVFIFLKKQELNQELQFELGHELSNHLEDFLHHRTQL